MSWIVVPRWSSTESNLFDSSLTSTEPVVIPRVLPISGVEEISHEDLFNLVMQDDEDSDYCIVNNDMNGIRDGTDGMKAISNNFNGAERSYNASFKTVSDDGPATNKSPLRALELGQPNLNSAGTVLVGSNVSLAESSKGAAVERKHHCFMPFDFSHSEKHVAAHGTNYYDQSVKDDMAELHYEIDLRLANNFEMKHMKTDGNCLFRAVASQVYGNSELYNLTRQTCVSFMVCNHEHFSPFVNENFVSYCMRKRNDKVYGELLELQALAHAYNRPVHIYSYSTEPVNVVHPPCAGNLTPIRLSYHIGSHYNSLVELQNEFPIGGGLQAGNPAKVTENASMNSSEAQHDADEQWIHNFRPGSSTGNLIAALLAWEAGAELNLGGTISMGPGVRFNSIELALCLGFEFQQVAAAYRKFGNDGTSMLYHLVENDTYEVAPI